MAAYTSRSYPRHTHDQFGIGLIDEGGHSSWSGRGQVEALAGGLICCNPGEVTDGRPVGRKPRAWRMVYIDADLVGELYQDVSERTSPFELTKPVFMSGPTRVAFERVFAQAAEPSNPSTEAATEALIALVACLQSSATDGPRIVHAGVGRIAAAKQRIDADPAADIKLSVLALDCGLTRYQLIRAFSKEVGLTPHAYIMQKRLQLARRLIRKKVALSDAALMAGFYDQPHLTKYFSRQFGAPPGEYASHFAR